jgi:hypothetical protein
MDRSLKMRLLSLVRKAWSDPFITTEYAPESGWRIDAVVAAVQDLHGYESEEEALVVAIECAPTAPDVSELTEEIDRLTEEIDRLKEVCNSYSAKLERERASTVAWMRGEVSRERAATVEWLRSKEAYGLSRAIWAAHCIERGEHRCKGEE